MSKKDANVTVVIGAQWGDEGKGKIIHQLARKADVIGRFTGGANAGHTVYVDGEKVKLQQIPSGILPRQQDCRSNCYRRLRAMMNMKMWRTSVVLNLMVKRYFLST